MIFNKLLLYKVNFSLAQSLITHSLILKKGKVGVRDEKNEKQLKLFMF